MEKLNEVAFEEYVENGKKALVVFSRQSCHVCEGVHKKVDLLEEEHPGIPFYEVDVEATPRLMSEYRLKGVPHVLFFRNGSLIKTLTGNHDEDEYADVLDEL